VVEEFFGKYRKKISADLKLDVSWNWPGKGIRKQTFNTD
jgi:hypothetical protein